LASFGHIWLIFAVAMSILKLSLEELVTALAKGHLTSSEVLKAYRARAELIHHACNAVACWIPEAEQRAREQSLKHI
jgi:Asp-tRNA(Asn)/Glu-tRNA(Gln) amidotransferase A subunit family amidase